MVQNSAYRYGSVVFSLQGLKTQLQKRWKDKEVQDELDVKSLADSLNISDGLAKLLVMRDIDSFQKAKEFFRPSLEFLHDPYLMDGMDAASLRVIEAITSNEKILVYGDYDVDGTCSTALMYLFLQHLGASVEYYIPNRLKEGYGISELGIDHAKSLGVTLMISVDCGITAVEETDYAKQQGIDLIICDHHQPKEVIPAAHAVLDPLKPGCNYPFKYLSGAGVAFKLAQGICERIGKHDLPLQYLDLVALAGAADIVPLVDENRLLVRMGLDMINEDPRPGIAALLNTTRIAPGNLTAGQIVFSIAPRINAVGRLSDASVAVELLITNDHKRASILANVLESENYERRKIDEGTLHEALEIVESTFDEEKDIAIVLHENDWHPGVIGIVASRLVDKYYRPTVMLTTIDGVAKGSARSIPDLNIYEALTECSDLLMHFGGHEAAAGLALEIGNIAEFRKRLNVLIRNKIHKGDLIPLIEIDLKLKFYEITPKFLRIVKQFAPFGPKNPRPTFLSEGVEAANIPRIVGNNHLLLTLKQQGCDKVFDAIGFGLGDFAADITPRGTKFDLVYTIDQMAREGRVYPQFKIKDLKVVS